MSQNKLKVGDVAPDFDLPSSAGGSIRLSLLRGKKVVICFYPKDGTSGCTREACRFRDLGAEFAELDCMVLGISRDGISSHKKFTEKHGLNMPLLADTDGSVCKAYGVIREKNMHGKKVMGIERSTFLIDENGQLALILRKVKPEEHVDELLRLIKEIQARKVDA